MIHWQLSDQEHAAVSEAKRNGASFDRPEMLCRTGDGHAQGTRSYSQVTCPACKELLEKGEPSVTRYVPTYVNKDGMRTILGANQGRFTYATAEEAQAYLDAVTKNNSADTIKQVWGENPRFEVREAKAYPGHFDLKNVWFDP